MTHGATFDIVLGLAMIAVILLGAGGIHLLRSRRDMKRGWLMLVAALVLFGNVLIWTL